MGPLQFFLGIDVQRDDGGFFLSQEKYAKEILERAGMSNYKAARTPADVRPKTSDTDGNLINDASWYRSMTVSRSSAEAEYRGVANAVAESSWLRQLLGELHCHIKGATIAYCDNVVYMARNPVHHRRTKHI